MASRNTLRLAEKLRLWVKTSVTRRHWFFLRFNPAHRGFHPRRHSQECLQNFFTRHPCSFLQTPSLLGVCGIFFEQLCFLDYQLQKKKQALKGLQTISKNGSC